MRKKSFYVIAFVLLSVWLCYPQDYIQEKQYRVHSAKQAVAVDGTFFYVIDNSKITKYTLQGEQAGMWEDTDPERIKHLNSGLVIAGKLYCAHSNYPDVPMASSIEVFDTETMTHDSSISLGIDIGSCTWILPAKEGWYVFFAHYDGNGKESGKDVSWSQLVEYDNQWRRKQGWVLPKDLIEEIKPHSLSGAVLIGNVFYCTGHDARKCYLLELPDRGMRLKWINTINIPFHGQGIAVDPEGNLWGIDRKDKLVIKAVKQH